MPRLREVTREEAGSLATRMYDLLFPGRDPIGRSVRIYGKPYLVVGTMAPRNHIIGAMGDNYVCVPWTTFEKDCLHTGVEDRNIALVTHEDADTDEVVSNITGTMRRERRLRPARASRPPR